MTNHLKEHYIIGFANKTFSGSVKHFMKSTIHKLTNLYNFEIDRPSGSRENSEKNDLHILHEIDANKKNE